MKVENPLLSVRNTVIVLAAAMAMSLSQAAAQEFDITVPERTALVTTQLIADVEMVAPGKPFNVGVLFTIADGWHIYWHNPGDSGLATQVKFGMPEGTVVGPLRWPTPDKFEMPGDIVGYGYSGTVLLMAEVTPPETLPPGEMFPMTAELSWLACKDKCVMERGRSELSVLIGNDALPANRDLFAKWMERTPPTAPDFTLTDQAGKTHTLSDYRGKVVVLEWFNPDCPFVQRHHVERNTMVVLAREYAQKDVVWLGVNSTKYMDTAANKAIHEKWSLPYPMLVDQDGKVGRMYGAKTTPHMFVIDPTGAIVYAGGIDDDPRGTSEAPTNHVAAALAELTSGKPVSTREARPYGCSVKYAE